MDSDEDLSLSLFRILKRPVMDHRSTKSTRRERLVFEPLHFLLSTEPGCNPVRSSYLRNTTICACPAIGILAEGLEFYTNFAALTLNCEDATPDCRLTRQTERNARTREAHSKGHGCRCRLQHPSCCKDSGQLESVRDSEITSQSRGTASVDHPADVRRPAGLSPGASTLLHRGNEGLLTRRVWRPRLDLHDQQDVAPDEMVEEGH